MHSERPTRRRFVVDAGRLATAGWLALQIPWLASLAACDADRSPEDGVRATLTAAERDAMRAFAAQILPADEHAPGAAELGAVDFVERALATAYFAPNLPVLRAGLAELDARARREHARHSFAALDDAAQIAVIRSMEGEPFFTTARMLVLVGAFADPSHGGNRDGAGWRMIGIDHRPSYSAPFGWYDARARVARGAA